MRLIKRREVESRTGLSKSAIYQLMVAGSFPLPVRLTAKSVGWHEDEIDDWVSSRPRAPRRGKKASTAAEASDQP
jgi:prophage regulatory protein